MAEQTIRLAFDGGELRIIVLGYESEHPSPGDPQDWLKARVEIDATFELDGGGRDAAATARAFATCFGVEELARFRDELKGVAAGEPERHSAALRPFEWDLTVMVDANGPARKTWFSAQIGDLYLTTSPGGAATEDASILSAIAGIDAVLDGSPDRRGPDAVSWGRPEVPLQNHGVARTSGPLSDDEWKVFNDLLRRYAEHDLDQWDAWRTETRYGTVYITISRAKSPAIGDEAFNLIDPPGRSEPTPGFES